MLLSNNQRGFTMVELLIGLLAAAVLTYAALSLYITQHKQLLVQEQIADMQASVRASAETMGKAIRMAGNNIPAVLTAIESSDSNPDTIVVTFDTGMVFGVELRYDLTDPYDEIRCLQGNDVSGLNEGDWAYILDPNMDSGEFFLISRVLAGPPRIQHNSSPLSGTYLAGSLILKIARIKYFVDQSDSTGSNLMIQTYGSQPEVFAENIVNLDFRYFLANGAIVTQTNNPGEIRMVEIDVLGRTAMADPDFAEEYRTRNFTLRVKVRNLRFGT